ncbi:restriction endonuclease subunit S [Moraxella sp. ZJ142]|uniref:restriction endonuclease subunit S n=1 Tax=Moraxella marmotae TaxID=3344520 RepID=UPI0035D52A7D
MSDWKIEKLSNLCIKIGSGSTPKGGQKVYLESGNTSLIRSQNIHNFNFSPNGLVYISDENANKLKHVSVDKNDVFINITGDSVARVCMPNEKYLPARVNQHVAILRPLSEILNSEYLKYYLLQPQMQNYLLGLSTSGATRNALTKTMLENIEIKFPNIEQQQEISKILGSLDEKIQLNTQINQTLEQIAQTIFKSWFIDFDPVRAKADALANGATSEQANLCAMQIISGKSEHALTQWQTTHPTEYQQLYKLAEAFPREFENVDGVEVPKGWAYASFGSLLEHTIGGDWGKEVADEKHTEKVAILRGTDLSDVYQGKDKNVPIRFVESKKLKSRKLKSGDIIIEVSGGSKNQPTGRSLFVTQNLINRFDIPLEPASFCRLLRPKDLKIGLILGIHLQLIYADGKTWEYQIQSTGISNFQTALFLEKELVVLPSQKILDEFFKLVFPLFENIHSCKNGMLEKLRDLLLPRLLSGEIEL